MKKSILALMFLLFSGIAFSQTTVTLQDQCNCEVLKGTDVSSPGAATPTGADLGDIYVNTNTGTIYFWDGNSWELTASDNQQLTGFTFNDVTNILSLSLEDGGNVNVDLSSLSDVFADSNTTVTSFDIDGTNTNLVITDSDANSYAVALADLVALINTDNQTLNEVLVQGNDAGGSAITNLADPTAAQDAATKAYVDSTADDDITGVSFNGGTNEVTVSEGATSFSADLSSLEESADIAANATDIATNAADITTNASNISTNTTDIATNASDIATNTADITTNASDIATNTTDIATNASDISTNTTDIATNASDIATNTTDIATNTTDIATNTTAIATNATDISTNTTDIANHIAADGDLSSTNEIQNIEEVLIDGNDANGLVLTGLGAPTAASDAATKAYVDSTADDDITGVSFNGGTNEVTVSEGATSFSADLSSLEESADIAANATDIATNAADITTNASNISTNTTDIATNASDIATNTADITTNASDIATNTTDIATNASDISTNTTDIATNASDIATNTTDIATNTTDIATNTTAIATNATDISTNTTDIANHIAAD
ncbi:beta strand repeat-containing protein, partial [Flagellimonas lutimaris]|uniref:beta strand repeat-containing protein n=1 Tax=Flagellimonas lutimaris TaxID=475082 RepID=UPI0039C0A80E